MDISKDNFIKLTTEGYPLELSHSEESFYEMFIAFVNATKENNFYADIGEDGVFMHAGMRTEVCKVCYQQGSVVILSKIKESNEYSLTSEFSKDEEVRILGMACLGVLYFCDLYAESTGQDELSKKNTPIEDEKLISKNIKYNAWPI